MSFYLRIISAIYEELRVIRQTSTVKEYNQKYYALIQDIPDLLLEIAYYHYVAGLKPYIHTFVKVLLSAMLQQAMRQAKTFDEVFSKGSPYDAFFQQRNQNPRNYTSRGDN